MSTSCRGLGRPGSQHPQHRMPHAEAPLPQAHPLRGAGHHTAARKVSADWTRPKSHPSLGLRGLPSTVPLSPGIAALGSPPPPPQIITSLGWSLPVLRGQEYLH
ncbi:Armadillo-Like Helical Domain-Containing Protein 3 [Manis pentadactyla]|nr:Armadillo-Like Helical Domain-Containing Protein 3 [Manis pentadactyla]